MVCIQAAAALCMVLISQFAKAEQKRHIGFLSFIKVTTLPISHLMNLFIIALLNREDSTKN